MSYTNSGFDLVPGLANFMEDTSVEVDVEVGDAPEEVEGDVEATETVEETAEASADQEQSEEQVEMINRSFDRLEAMRAHIQKYGVSRDFMAWVNRDGSLAAGLNIAIPSLESIDTVGDPNSTLSIACMEAADDRKWYQKVWDFIKKICRKVWEFIQRIFEFIKRLIFSTDRNIGRLRKAMENRVAKDKDELKDVKAKIFSFKDLTDAANKSGKGVETKIGDGINMIVGVFNGDPAQLASLDSAKLDEVASIIDDVNAILKNADKPENVKTSEQPVESGTVVNEIKQFLDFAASERAAVDAVKKIGETVHTAVKKAQGWIANAEKRRDLPEGVTSKARKAASSLNKVAGTVGKLLKFRNKLAAQAVKSASVLMSKGTKKK